MKVIIASENPTKIESVRQAFTIVWPNKGLEFIGVAVNSGVSEMPLSEDETIKGARNRISNARKQVTHANFYVGLEGGTYKLDGKLFLSDWVAVEDKHGFESLAGTPRYHIPERIARHLTPDFHLTAAIEKELGMRDMGKKQGYSGMVTGNYLTRANSNRDAVMIALAPFVRDFLKA